MVGAALVATGCVGPSLSELTESIDAVAVPATWELVAEEVRDRPCRDPVENCPKVERIYRVPGPVGFAMVVTTMLEDADFEVWDPPIARCGPSPERGCNAGARRDRTSLRAVVVEVDTDSYVVNLRASEYVGP